MNIERDTHVRSGSKCELCKAVDRLSIYEVSPAPNGGCVDDYVLLCGTCLDQIEKFEDMDSNHWRCLNESMWSEIPAVQVMAWRMLQRLKSEGWSQNLLDMLYMEEDTLIWAQSTSEMDEKEETESHKDCNGVKLIHGDSVIIIKDLNVKGGGFTAKRGTIVRNITLVSDDPKYIEGKVNGQLIVLLTQYVRKS